MDTDSFVLSVNTKNIINHLKILEDIFDFSNLYKSQEIFSKKNNALIGFLKMKHLKIYGLMNLFV